MKRLNDSRYNTKGFGVYSVVQCSLVDKPYGAISNTPNDYLEKLLQSSGQVPITVSPIKDRIATPADVIAFGPDVVAGVDRIITVRPRVTVPNGSLPLNLALAGFYITQQFTQQQVTPEYTLSMRSIAVEGTALPSPPIIFDNYSRNIQVSPSGGANSTAEFFILPVTSANQFTYDSAGLGSLPTPAKSMEGFLDPLHISNNVGTPGVDAQIATSLVFIFKNQATVSQTIALNPMFIHEGTCTILDAIFDKVLI